MNSRTRLALFASALVGLAGQCDPTVNNDGVSVSFTIRGSVDSADQEVFGFSFLPSLSNNGRLVTFSSRAGNLHPDDPDTELDVFVHNFLTGETILVSRADGPAGVKADQESSFSNISGDGQVVAFQSHSANLDPADLDTSIDIYARNIVTDSTILVSRATGAPGVKANASCILPTVSFNGSRIAFASDATNLHPDDSDATRDIFVRDVLTNTTTLVSRATGVSGAKSNGVCMNPVISEDGRYVAFLSKATNLDPDDGDTANDVFVRDLLMNTTVLATRATGVAGAKATLDCSSFAFSGNGRFVAFTTAAESLLPAGEDRNSADDVLLRDLLNSTTVRVSLHDNGSEAVADCTVSSISSDGRFVAFQSFAPLVAGDNNQTSDIFVRDTLDGRTIRASVHTYGVEANGDSSMASISGNGRFVAFISTATNMVDQDNNGVTDIFVRGPLH